MRIWQLMIVAGCATALNSGALAQTSTPAKPAPAQTKPATAAKPADQVIKKQVNPSGTITKKTADGQRITTHKPIPDTEENRALHGGPKSETGRNTKPSGR